MQITPYAIVVLVTEIGLFFTELIWASSSKKNRRLRETNTLDNIDFISLEYGYRTSISLFRISLFVAYLLFVMFSFDSFTTITGEVLVLYVIGGILVYLLAIRNIKTFIFYNDHFIISTPFNFFRSEQFIEYNAIHDYRIYRALYNSCILILNYKDGTTLKVQFSGSSLPRNDHVIRVILNSKLDLKDYSWVIDDFEEEEEILN
jgi:hypothetical protein